MIVSPALDVHGRVHVEMVKLAGALAPTPLVGVRRGCYVGWLCVCVCLCACAVRAVSECP